MKTKSGRDSHETVGIEKIQEVRAIIMKRLNEKITKSALDILTKQSDCREPSECVRN